MDGQTDGGTDDYPLPVVGKCSIGSTCRNGLEAGPFVVFLLSVRILTSALKKQTQNNLNNCPKSTFTCAHARHLLTYSAAVSSVCVPSGTSFSNHISSWMTATASLTYAARSVTAGPKQTHGTVRSRGDMNTGQILVLW